MKILFICRGGPEKGSDRIWVHDLSDYMRGLGHHAEIQPEPIAGDFDAVILAKGCFSPRIVQAAKAANPDAKVGWINATMDPQVPVAEERATYRDVDFFIVGSIEERDSLLEYKDAIFIFPLVERIYTRRRYHRDKKVITIGYHGNEIHLRECFPDVTRAIDALAEEIPLRLIAIHTPVPGWEWTTGRPSIEVEQVPWDIGTIEEQLLRCDIGIVPGMTPISRSDRQEIFATLKDRGEGDAFGGYDTDYLLRFKNKSNAGRSFVFHQLHIPVVACFMPSHFHILGYPDCGYLAHSSAGWLDGLRALARSAKRRGAVARAAAREFERLYDPMKWAERLCQQIHDLHVTQQEQI